MSKGFVPEPAEPSDTGQKDVSRERSQSARALLRRFWKPAVGAGGSVGGLLWLWSRRAKKKHAKRE
jgi:hypothetical protein